MNGHVTQALWTPRCQPRRLAEAAITTVTITCRVCSAKAVVTLSNDVLLCQTCQANPVAAQATLDRRTALVWEAFLAVLVAAMDTDIERYGRVCCSRQRLNDDRKDDTAYGASVARRLAAAHAAGDGLSVILAAETRLHEQLDALERARNELDWAGEERTSV